MNIFIHSASPCRFIVCSADVYVCPISSCFFWSNEPSKMSSERYLSHVYAWPRVCAQSFLRLHGYFARQEQDPHPGRVRFRAVARDKLSPFPNCSRASRSDSWFLRALLCVSLCLDCPATVKPTFDLCHLHCAVTKREISPTIVRCFVTLLLLRLSRSWLEPRFWPPSSRPRSWVKTKLTLKQNLQLLTLDQGRH